MDVEGAARLAVGGPCCSSGVFSNTTCGISPCDDVRALPEGCRWLGGAKNRRLDDALGAPDGGARGATTSEPHETPREGSRELVIPGNAMAALDLGSGARRAPVTEERRDEGAFPDADDRAELGRAELCRVLGRVAGRANSAKLSARTRTAAALASSRSCCTEPGAGRGGACRLDGLAALAVTAEEACDRPDNDSRHDVPLGGRTVISSSFMCVCARGLSLSIRHERPRARVTRVVRRRASDETGGHRRGERSSTWYF